MVYMGSKRKYKKYILPIINKYIKDNNITFFYDIFCGGANLADEVICDNIICNDLSPTLIALHQQAQLDPTRIPSTGNRQWWDDAYSDYKILLKNYPIDMETWNQHSKMPLWQMGAIEWYSSFSNGGYSRGYAKPSHDRDYYNEAYRNHQKQAQEENYKKIKFQQGDYRTIEIKPNALIYADSPYKGTKPYQINPKFNHEEYYNWLREKSKTNPIFISEQSMPEDFPIIWQKDDATRTCGLDNNFKACEKLYFIDNRVV